MPSPLPVPKRVTSSPGRHEICLIYGFRKTLLERLVVPRRKMGKSRNESRGTILKEKGLNLTVF